MRIGILTFHTAENYGAFLQTYASVEMLKSLDKSNEVKVINYKPTYISNTYKLYFPKLKESGGFKTYLRSLFINILFTPKRIIRKFKFKLSLRALPLVSKEEPFDIIYLGSDQIWNSRITKGVDGFYYGENTSKGTKKIAYAVSLGDMIPDEEESKRIRELCENIEKISTREKSGAKILESIINGRIYTVLDPTLLVNSSIWNQIAKEKERRKYVLTYQLSNDNSLFEDAIAYAEKRNLDVISLNEIGMKKKMNSNVRVISVSQANPFEFLGLIKNADCVITDSFHGTCFSLIFNKQFYTYLNSKRNERKIELLYSIGLDDRIVNQNQHIDLSIKDIDYSVVNDSISNLKKESIEFLKEAMR